MTHKIRKISEEHAASRLSEIIMGFHADALNDGDTQLFEAVAIKCVALLVLAFGIPATSDEKNPDMADAVFKLLQANRLLLLAGQLAEEPQR